MKLVLVLAVLWMCVVLGYIGFMLGYNKGSDDMARVSRRHDKKRINEFRNYQIDWLTSHNDIELDDITEQMVVDFLKDTARAFEMEEQK